MVRYAVLALLALVPLMGAECGGGLPDPEGGAAGQNQAGGGGQNQGGGAGGGQNAGDQNGDDAAATLEQQLGGRVLTEIRNSSNIDPLGGPAFIQFFRADLELCSNRRFDYFEVDETTISFVVERDEFAGQGEWSVRIDAATQAPLLVLDFQQVSEGEPFQAELTIDLNLGGESFLNGTRMFVTDGDDVCE